MLMLSELDQPGSISDQIGETEFLETRFYSEWCRPQDYYEMAGTSRQAELIQCVMRVMPPIRV